MSELVVLTTYFNPCRYVSRRQNYDVFMQGMRAAGLTCITVECAFGDAAFELPTAADVLQLRSATLLWQKERLLNLAASWLPASCRYVAWLDCDILFDNRNWARELVAVLQQYPVAQVWQSCLRLQKDGREGALPDRVSSFAAVMQEQPGSLQAGRYDTHGHTGYGWAMQRSLFDSVGLYEAAISGSADHFMAHAIYGDYNFCIQNALKHDHAQIAHLQAWGQRFYQQVQGRLGVVKGEIRHLWHGEAQHRRYFLRMHEITDLGFNPWTDLSVHAGRALEWHADMHKPGLRQYFVDYFLSRHEDGEFKELPASQERPSHA